MESAEKLTHDEPATILLGEDEGAIRDMVAAFLSDIGYRVLAVTDAKDALRVLDEHREIALLLTDVTLPGLTTGFALAEQVHRQHPAIKFIYTTGRVREADWPGWDDGRARLAVHTAFEDPTTPAGAPPRESIEVRTFAFF